MIGRSAGLSVLHKVFMLLTAALLCSLFVPVVAEASAAYSNEKIVNDLASMQGLQDEVDYPEFDYFDEEYIIDAADGAVVDLYIDMSEYNPMLRSVTSFTVPVRMNPNSSGTITLNLYGGYNSYYSIAHAGEVMKADFSYAGRINASSSSTYITAVGTPDALVYDLSVEGQHAVVAGGNGSSISYAMYFPCFNDRVEYATVVQGSFTVSYNNTSAYFQTGNISVSAGAPSVLVTATDLTLASIYDDTTYEKLMYEFWTSSSNSAFVAGEGGVENLTFKSLLNWMTYNQYVQYLRLDSLNNFFTSNIWSGYVASGGSRENISLQGLFDLMSYNQFIQIARLESINSSINTQDYNISSKLDNLTNGYQNEELASGSVGFESTLTGFNNSLGVIVNGVESDLSDPSTINHVFEFTAGLNSALQFVGSFETVFLVYSGDFTTVIPLLYSLVFLSILVGLWRFFKR